MQDQPNLRYRISSPFPSNPSYTTTLGKHSLISITAKKNLPNLHQTFTRFKPHRHNLSFTSKQPPQSSLTKSFYHSERKETVSILKPYLLGKGMENTIASNRYKAVSRQGRRSYNQDRYICKPKMVSPFLLSRKHSSSLFDLYGVFDGHGGSTCAQFLKQNFPILLSRCPHLNSNPKEALKETFSKVQQKFMTICQNRQPLETSGSCGVVCLLNDKQLHVANLGDCRAILLSKESYLVLTRDHKPNDQDERFRILRHGGKLYRDQEGTFNQIKVFRQVRVIPGNLNVSRTIGDIEVKLKKYGGLPGMISSTPDISSHTIDNYKMLLLGSDGLFEAFSSEEIHKLYQTQSQQGTVTSFADRLCQWAEEKSSDNITVVTVFLE